MCVNLIPLKIFLCDNMIKYSFIRAIVVLVTIDATQRYKKAKIVRSPTDSPFPLLQVTNVKVVDS